MDKQQAIEMAKQAKQNNPELKGVLYVATDGTVFTEPSEGVGYASALNAGNPVLIEVSEEETGLQTGDAGNLTKAQKVEAAKVKVAAMQKIFDEKAAAKDEAEGSKRGAATTAFNKAKANLELAQKELSEANDLPE